MKDFEPEEYKSIKETEGLESPPMDWFWGVGFKDSGIMFIGLSDQFTSLADGILYYHHYLIWADWYAKNLHVPKRIVNPDEELKAKQSASFVKRITGFKPEEIVSTLNSLKEYEGKTKAPFPHELH